MNLTKLLNHCFKPQYQPLNIKPGTKFATILRNSILEEMGRLLTDTSDKEELRATAKAFIRDRIIESAQYNPITRRIHFFLDTPNGKTHLILNRKDTHL